MTWLVFEHVLLLIKVLIHVIIPDQAASLTIIKARQRYYVRLCNKTKARQRYRVRKCNKAKDRQRNRVRSCNKATARQWYIVRSCNKAKARQRNRVRSFNKVKLAKGIALVNVTGRIRGCIYVIYHTAAEQRKTTRRSLEQPRPRTPTYPHQCTPSHNSITSALL